MPKVPVHVMVVNQPTGRTHTLRLLRRGGLSTAVIVGFLATTAAVPGPGASQAELMMYSLGSALAIIMAVRIVIKLFVYLVKAAVVLAVLGVLYTVIRIVVGAVTGG
jgi:hypothetical protein